MINIRKNFDLILFIIVCLLFFYLFYLLLPPAKVHTSIDRTILDKLIIKMLEDIELELSAFNNNNYNMISTHEYYTIVINVIDKHVYNIEKWDFYRNDNTLFYFRLLKEIKILHLQNPDYYPLKALHIGLRQYGFARPNQYPLSVDLFIYNFEDYSSSYTFPSLT